MGNPPIERWKVKKDGGDFDQFAGATITPRGVMVAIRSGLEFFAANKSTLTKAD
jgi:electron transport complex protein RnfG